MKLFPKKALLLISLLIIGNLGYSQNALGQMGNFKFENEERTVFWVQVFELKNTVDFVSAKKYFVDNQIFEIISEDSSSFIGNFNPKPIDIQKYGYKRGTTPMFLLDVEQVFTVNLEYKDGKYRATLSKMGYIDNGVVSDLVNRSLVGISSTTAKGNIVSYDGDFSFTSKNEVRTRNQTGFEILNKFYLDILTIKEKDKSSSDW
jgi:hypothetical protein